MGRAVSSSTKRIEPCMFYIYGKLLLKKKFAIEQIETEYKGSTLEAQFYPELESHICTWLGNQSSDAIKRKASNRCATPSAGVMLTEYHFSVFPTPDRRSCRTIYDGLQPSHYGLWCHSKLGTTEGFYPNTRGGRTDAVPLRYAKGLLSYHSTSSS